MAPETWFAPELVGECAGRAAQNRGQSSRLSGRGVKQIPRKPIRARPRSGATSRDTSRRLLICSGGSPARPLRQQRRGKEMRIERRYTKEGQSPYTDITFRLTGSEIRNPDGSVVFRADNVEVPSSWSQVAAD